MQYREQINQYIWQRKQRKNSRGSNKTSAKTARVKTKTTVSISLNLTPFLQNRLSANTIPFRQWLADHGYRFADSPYEADIYMGCRPVGTDSLSFPNKKNLLITLEPYLSSDTQKLQTLDGKLFLISNCYVNSLLTTNYAVFPWMLTDTIMNFNPGKVPFADIKRLWNKRRKTACAINQTSLANLYQPRTSLQTLRTKLALYGYVSGIVDVAGKGWPGQISTPINNIYSGKKEPYTWIQEKLMWLKEGYLFNLCFENANIPYYVSEKIWHAIISYCVPIYYSNDTIYETFPKGSFIDYRDFKDPKKLCQYIDSMTADEYLDRLNLGIQSIGNYRKEHIQTFTQWQVTARQHILNNLVQLQEMQ